MYSTEHCTVPGKSWGLGYWVLGIGIGNWVLGLSQRFYCRSWVLFQKWKCPDGNPHRAEVEEVRRYSSRKGGPIPTEEFTCTVPYYFVLQSTSLEIVQYKIGGSTATWHHHVPLSHYASSSSPRKLSTRLRRVRDAHPMVWRYRGERVL
jgi:hypothetical protein